MSEETRNPEAQNPSEHEAETASAESRQDPQAEIEQLKQQLAETEKALSEADLRAQAEVQNMRRRAERDVENAHKYALEKFSKELLAVVDSLERALEALPEEDESLKAAREGNSLTLKLLLDTLGKFGIEQLNPIGEVFDPQFHEAMTMVPNPDAEDNTIMDVLQRGYLLNGRLLRPAMVVVVKNN